MNIHVKMNIVIMNMKMNTFAITMNTKINAIKMYDVKTYDIKMNTVKTNTIIVNGKMKGIIVNMEMNAIVTNMVMNGIVMNVSLSMSLVGGLGMGRSSPWVVG